jgi:hypothetical protein
MWRGRRTGKLGPRVPAEAHGHMTRTRGRAFGRHGPDPAHANRQPTGERRQRFSDATRARPQTPVLSGVNSLSHTRMLTTLPSMPEFLPSASI